MRFFCPGCWRDFPTDEARCPHCGLDIPQYWQTRDYVAKLIVALSHPEKETVIRAAWILGKLKDERAVRPLMELAQKSADVYVAREAVRALGELGTPEACRFLGTLSRHPAKLVRDEIQRLLKKKASSAAADR